VGTDCLIERQPRSDPVRVCHVITGLGAGGAEAVLYRLVKADDQNTHHVISLLDDLGFYGGRLTAAGVRCDALNLPRGHVSTRGLRLLHRRLREANPDIVQTWMYHADLVGGLAARLAGLRSVVWGVHCSNLERGMISRSTRTIARLSGALSRFIPARIICCSEMARRVHADLGYVRTKMVVIPNGIDLSEFTPDASLRERTRRELHIHPDEVLLGMVSRWDVQKDHANLIGGLKVLAQDGPGQWRCVLVGAGMTPENADLRALLRAAGVEDRMCLLGTRRDIPAIMNALDVHVLSSSGEAFGNVTVEAMACGVPAVVTAVGAGPFIVGETGWVVPPSDPSRLAGAIREAIAVRLTSPLNWRARQTAARERITANFGLGHMVTAYRSVWSDVMAAGASSHPVMC